VIGRNSDGLSVAGIVFVGIGITDERLIGTECLDAHDDGKKYCLDGKVG